MKIKVVTDSSTSYIVEANKGVYLAPHFRLVELANNKGDPSQPQWIDSPQSRLFVVMLEAFRQWYDLPMTINSGYRQSAFNRSVGGDPRSAHVIACAADWGIKGHTEAQRKHVRDKWQAICRQYNVVGAINYYTGGYHLEAFSDKCYGNKGFVVRDYRGTKRDW